MIAALLTVADLAARYGVTERTVRRWHNDGALPAASSPGRSPRWNRDVVDAFERAGQPAPRTLRAVS